MLLLNSTVIRTQNFNFSKNGFDLSNFTSGSENALFFTEIIIDDPLSINDFVKISKKYNISAEEAYEELMIMNSTGSNGGLIYSYLNLNSSLSN